MPRRSAGSAAIESIFESAIDVLIDRGVEQLSLYAVKDRAGVSMPTLTKYFHKKEDLIRALIEWRLGIVAQRMERVCLIQRGKPLRSMVKALIDEFWDATFERRELSLAFHGLFVTPSNRTLVSAFDRRVEGAMALMFGTAPDDSLGNVTLASLTIFATLSGAVRSFIERELPSELLSAVHEQVFEMCSAYIATIPK